MGKRGKNLKRKRLGLAPEPAVTRVAAAAEEEDDEEAGAGPMSSAAGGLELSELEVETTIVVLEKLQTDLAYFRSKALKRLRAALGPLATALVGEDAAKTHPRGKRRRDADHRLSAEDKFRMMDRDALNSRALRAERLARLEKSALEGEGDEASLLMIADGPAMIRPQPRLLLPEEGVDEAVLRKMSPQEEEEEEQQAKLHAPRTCYVCKSPFVDLHFFYAALCPACAAVNWAKREEACDLGGKCALVTGARVKIGFRCALKLLRCGATVCATTRFPADCASRFAREPDRAEWQHRLRVVGADFRDLRAVEQLCDALPTILGSDALHVIVNNACQTVRRPPQYYAPLLDRELHLRKQVVHQRQKQRQLLKSSSLDDQQQPGGGSRPPPPPPPPPDDDDDDNDNEAPPAPSEDEDDVHVLGRWLVQPGGGSLPSMGGLLANSDPDEMPPGMSLSAADTTAAGDPSVRATLAVAPGDGVVDGRAFPRGRTDANADLGQQLDLRTTNSWMLKLEDVSTPEAAEVFAINTLAPFVLNSRLKPMLVRDAEALKFIVNVSAMEGKFYRHKQPHHPHTNMAKAALNMMTRTSAADYAKANIYMTAVDTGWINDEKPLNLAKKHADLHDFQTPLDEVDAAARVLDPIIAPMRRLQTGEDPDPPYGVFLKDYAQCEW